MSAVLAPVRFHLSLNVADLNRSIVFYEILFNRPPAKRHDDYAKFEPDDPPLVLSLAPRKTTAGGALSHLGLRVADRDAVTELGDRLAEAGLNTRVQEETVCGYARQHKCWVSDPDGNFWEIYVVEEDVEPCASNGNPPALANSPQPLATTWEHYVTDPCPDRIPFADGVLQEVRLTGTFNADLLESSLVHLVHEAFRVLQPGGQVVVHGLMADKDLASAPSCLPGLAALVRVVPSLDKPLTLLRKVGFVGLFYSKLSPETWFQHEGVGMREVKLIGRRSDSSCVGQRMVLYRGPFGEVEDEAGHCFPRGQIVAVCDDTWQALNQGVAASQFLFFDGEVAGCSPCGETVSG